MKDINFENLQSLMNEFSQKYSDIALAIKSVMTKRVKWHTVEFIINETPEPSKRPRVSYGRRIYVPGAAKHRVFFDKYVRHTLNDLFITTPCKVKVECYFPTPKSFSKVQKLLAEMKILRPWVNIGDVDNLFKTFTDPLCPSEKLKLPGIMADDSLIIDSQSNKYYSMTPRVEVTISYMGKIPDEIKKILRIN